jgi:membrane associated rhomboid family serine protease
MFIPLHDSAPIRRIGAPVVSWAVMGLCVAAFAASQAGVLPPVEPYLAAGFGIIPKVLFGEAYLPAGLPQAPAWATPLTSLFLHAGWAHLIGNMLFLWVFADNVEDDFGHARFLLFYLICGVIAALCHAVINPGSGQPLIGASGAISGVIGAYVLLNPRVRIWGLVLKYIPLAVPAWAAIGGWAGFQLMQAFFGSDAAVAWFAHIGGLVAGLALTPLFLPRDVSLVQRWRAQAPAGPVS